MRILFLCGREAAYPLNRFLIDSARRFAEVDVPGESGSGASILLRSLRVSLEAGWKLQTRRYDLVFVGFFGHFLMRPPALSRRTPVLFHPFISAWETLVEDRMKYASDSLPARAAFRLDRMACARADHLLLDTQANIEFFSRKFSAPIERFSRIFIGSDERLFAPRPEGPPGEACVVLFHGSYLPLHGIDVILRAAAGLKDKPNIRFRLVGRGPGYSRITALAGELGLGNVEFVDSVPLEKLPDIIAGADICLGGHFGDSDKALRVIAGKTFQDIAMGKPTIVGDTRANHELLTHGVDAWFVPPGDPAGLAAGIAALAEQPELRRQIGAAAVKTFRERASMEVLAPQVKAVVEKTIAAKNYKR